MKKNVIAILLSVSLIAGSFGAAPLYAAEVTAQEAESEQDLASVPSEEESPAAEEEETEADPSSESADEQTVENEPVEEGEQNVSSETEEIAEESSAEPNENGTEEEEVLSDEENADGAGSVSTDEEAGNVTTDEEAESKAADESTETADVVEPALESTEGKEEALAGEAGDVVASGSCGDNATWTLTGTEDHLTFIVSGSGNMYNYGYSTTPWYDYRESIGAVVLEEGITAIGDFSFCDFSNMTSIIIPTNVTTIGFGAFMNCRSLSSMTIPEGVTIIKEYAFENCRSLESIAIPDGVTSINSGAFLGCSSLDSVTLPNGVTSISSNVFNGCSLTRINIPDGLKINSLSFSGCYVKEIYLNSLEKWLNSDLHDLSGDLYVNNEPLTNVIIPEGITKIRDNAFKNCTSLESITIPETVESIGNAVFCGCSNLNNITLPSSMTSIGYDMFANCISLKSITIPEAVTSIGSSAFLRCSNLNNITLPSNITSIDGFAFYGCISLKSITIPDGVTSINSSTFSRCSSLTSITIPDSVTFIKEDAFAECDSLGSITIPEGVTNIGDRAFYDCRSLENIVIPDSVTHFGASVFGNVAIYADVDVYVVKASMAEEYFHNNNRFRIHYLYEPESEEVSSIYLKTKRIVLQRGDVAELSDFLIVTDNSYLNSIAVTDYDDSVVLYDNGMLAAITNGTTSITVSCEDETFIIPVDVVEATTSATGILIEPESMTMQLGEKTVLPLDFIPEVSVIDTVQWNSSNPEVVSVDHNGFVKALQVGSSTITAYSGNLSASCEITVVKNPEAIISFDEESIDRGESKKLFCYIYPSGSEDSSAFTFVSENPEIVEVSADGTITANSPGTTNVVITYGELTKTVLVTVSAKLKGISLNQTSIRLYKNDTLQLEVIYDPEDTTDDRTVQWTSNNENVAVVDENGHVTACGKGIAKISASVGDYTASCTIVCASVSLTSIELPGELTVEYGNKLNPELTYIPENTTEATKASWASGDTDIFTVSEEGVVTPTGIGTATLTATVGELTATSEITVIKATPEYEAPGTIEAHCGQTLRELTLPDRFEWMDDQDLVVGWGGEHTYAVIYTPDDIVHYNTVDDITVVVSVSHAYSESWEAGEDTHWHECACGEKSDEAEHVYGEWVVTIEPTCEEIGEKQRVCTVCGHVDTEIIDATGYIHLTGIELPESMTAEYSINLNPKLTYKPENTTDDKTATWTSSDTDIFTVSEEGVVTPTGIGTATLTATVGEFSDTSEITVIKGTPEHEIPVDLTAYCGQTLTEVILPEGFEWKICEQDVGDYGTTNSFYANFTPEDTDHYNLIKDIAIDVRVEHNPSAPWMENEELHWRQCMCGEIFDEESHIYDDEVMTTAPSCETDGRNERMCTVCGHVDVKIIPATGHDWDSEYTVDLEPTCSKPGEKSIHCKTCEMSDGDSVVEIPALGHLYGEVVIEPTCTTGGYTIHVCGRCSDSYKEHETAPTGHSFGDWIIDHDSTCTEEGIQHRECTECGYIETKGINKKEHSFDTEFTVDKEPTCTTDGSRSYHCTSEGCTATTGSEVIPATGHEYSEWEVTREATCTESGEMQRTCATCDETEIVEYGARGHVWLKTPTVDKEATCTEGGSESIRCAVCDEIKEGSEHVIPAAGHALTHVEEVPATYESEGNIEFYWCDTCGKIFSDESCEQELSEDETVIPKMDRIPVKIVSQPADIEVAAGEQATFKVAAEGSDLSYQWQYTLNGSYWSNCKGAGYDTDTFSFAMDKKYAGRQYRCILTSGDEKVTSDAAVLRLKETNKITLQPADVNAAIGETVAFHVEATGEELSYQWQYSVNGTYWGNCTGSSYNTDTFSFAMQERFDGRQYRCVVTADGNKLISNAVSAILKQAGEIVEQPQNQKAGVGENVSFHVGFSGDDPEYQWQYSLDGSYWSNCKGNSYNLDTFSFVMQEKFDGRRYRCIVTAGGLTYTSDIVTVRISENQMITSQPEDVTLTVGENASFHVGTAVSGVTYQWQWSSDGKTWKNCTGAGYNTDTFSFATQTRFSGRKYRCMVTDGAKTEYSDGGLLTVTK